MLARVEQNDVTVLRPVLWILRPRRDVSTSCEPHFPACCATTLLTLNKRQLSSNCTSSLKYRKRFVGLQRDTLALTCMNVMSVLWCNEMKDFFITEVMMEFLSPLLHLTSGRTTVYNKILQLNSYPCIADLHHQKCFTAKINRNPQPKKVCIGTLKKTEEKETVVV